ncbi:hypothetical protein KUV50_10980 [Membranicola marinus]|uniref:N,N-dimethylformamidase beta subunit-like C-terminal domain-containing protein n=1 Tax=Membranihabitans marinus TaxID=1227546 RepID=A0A953HUR2_9BACT|nr:N,N-dimethylformamidase beta subunit family domain-containing protein [Membranihabitans marinus]MBY5958660.1 hypothetical protein [Membranihabitans marinus]
MGIEKNERREFIKKATLAGVGASLPFSSTTISSGEKRSKVISIENGKPGSDDWQLTRVRPDQSGQRMPWIEGYCSRQSVRAGETIDIMVSTDPVREFTVEIFRTGYYDGKGARLMKKLGPFQGVIQKTPEPGEKNIHECQWDPALSVEIEEDWVSGVYLGRLSTVQTDASDAYWQSYVVFIVKDDRPADVLFQCSDNTWQAYNRWPDKYSVYTDPKGIQGPWAKVSFDRPYGRQSQYNAIVNDPLSFGSGEYLSFEFPMAYFLEKHGYDVTYCSNSDLVTPDRGLKCKAFLSVGHDEYWDIRQYRSVEKMRDQGINLLFFSGNSVCWVSPFTPNSSGKENRTLFRGGPYGGDYKYAVLREERHGPFPERGPDEGYLMGVRNISPVNGGGDWVITNPDHWIFDKTKIRKGDGIPGLVGWEYHGDPPDIPGLEVVASGTAWQGGDNPQTWSAVLYPGPKNNFVFNASTIFWCQGLSRPPGHTLPWSHFSRPHGPDERVQQITHNLLNRSIK